MWQGEQQALFLLKEMGTMEATPNAVNYSSAVIVSENIGEWRQTLFLLRKMGTVDAISTIARYNAATRFCGNEGV